MRSRLPALGALLVLVVLFGASPGARAAVEADTPLGDLVHPPQFKLSQYDEVAAAGLVVRARSTRPEEDRFEVEEVLKGRAGADDLDAHLHLPSPLQPFADLAELYWRSAREDERTAVLWALEESRHAEAPGFLAGLLTGGRDLGRELLPIAYDLAARGDEPEIAHLAAALGADSDVSARRAGLAAFVRLAEPRDLDLAWQRLADLDVDRFWEVRLLAPWLAERTRPAEFPARYRRLPARARLALAAAAAAYPAETFLRGLVLAGDDPSGQLRRLSADELAQELAAAPADSPPRRTALLLAASSSAGGWRSRWWMLRAARGEEAVVLLAWFAQHPPGADELLALAREALAAGELDRALWVVAAAAPALLVPIARQLDEEATAAAPWLPARPASGDEWIESSYEAGAPAVGAVVLAPWIAAAGEADVPLVVRALSHADRPRAGPLRRPVLEALLDGWVPAKDVSAAPIRALLERQAADGEEWVLPYLDRLPAPPEAGN